MDTQAKSAAVVGCGVIGLTTAIIAQQAGYKVTIYSDRPATDTTSARAAASFKPTEIAYGDVAHAMLQVAQADYMRIVRDHGELSGVRRQFHWEAASSPFAAPDYLQRIS